MSIAQLEYILAIHSTSHFGRAAKLCGVTQPTLSMQVQKFEDQIGAIIFDRSKNPVVPTLIGEKIIAQAKKIVFEYKNLDRIVDISLDKIEGHFNLGIIPTLAPTIMPFIYDKLIHELPLMRFNIFELTTDQIISHLNRDQLDGAILSTPLKIDNIVERVLFYEDLYCYSSSDSNLLKKENIEIDDLENEDMVLLEEGHCLRTQVKNLCKLRNEKETKVLFEAGSLQTLINIVNNSKSCTVIPYLTTINLSKKDQERVRPFTLPVPSREISLIYSRLFQKEPILDWLEKVILESLPAELKSPKKGNLNIVEFR